MRALVSTVPTWGLAIIFIGGTTLLALVGFLLLHRLGLRSPSTGADTMVSAFSGKATALFGILLVFTIMSEFNHVSDAEGTAQREATALAQMVRDSGAFPVDVQASIRAAVAAYANAVVHDEWRELGASGKASEVAAARLGDL